MEVYIVVEHYDAYPEDGGGLQGNCGAFDDFIKAKKRVNQLEEENSPDYFYTIEKWEVE